jgi:hypothetical protein
MGQPLFTYWLLHQPFTRPQFLQFGAFEADGGFTGSLNEHPIAGNGDAKKQEVSFSYEPIAGKARVITEYTGARTLQPPMGNPQGQGLMGEATHLGAPPSPWWAESLIY